MPPDFVLRCTACGNEVLWDTDQLPPAGTPLVGHPVLWPCQACGNEQRHRIQDLFVVPDKLRHAVSVATEIDRPTVDRIMAAADRFRESHADSAAFRGSAEELAAVAEAANVPAGVVERITVAEAAWLYQRGYIQEITADL